LVEPAVGRNAAARGASLTDDAARSGVLATTARAAPSLALCGALLVFAILAPELAAFVLPALAVLASVLPFRWRRRAVAG
jgi:hypothetical protein